MGSLILPLSALFSVLGIIDFWAFVFSHFSFVTITKYGFYHILIYSLILIKYVCLDFASGEGEVKNEVISRCRLYRHLL